MKPGTRGEEANMSPEEISVSLSLLRSRKVALFIVAYNAQNYIASVMDRIPKDLLPLFEEVFIIDDSSTDDTFEVAGAIKTKYRSCNINIYRTPFNRGYGGNQKLGFLYCIEKNYDIVVLLHGDGQYAPEYLPRILAAFRDDTTAVFGSRMMDKAGALKGGMPLYKWLGNQALTHIENRLLGTNLSEFHTGCRAYSVDWLKKVPFIHNTDDFHFDTEIIIQLLATKSGIVEVPVPTFYGEEKSHVNSIKYGFDCLSSVLRYHAVNMGLFYSRNFDFGLFDTENYRFKKSPRSLHQHVLGKRLNKDMRTIELGANSGILSSSVAEKVREHWAVDLFEPHAAGSSKAMAMDLNNSFSDVIPGEYFEACFALDVIEHLEEPEQFLEEVFKILAVNGSLYISTANISYLPMRLMLLLGQFNYGKRGILDMTHKRLFTVSTFRRLLTAYGFDVIEVRGFAPPLTDLISKGRLMRIMEWVHTLLARLAPSLLSYNFLVTARRRDSIEDIFHSTTKAALKAGIGISQEERLDTQR